MNLVTGFGPTAGAPLAAHPAVDKVTFTGETGTGRKIMEAASFNMKRVSLELGGKSPSLVFADADLDAAVEGTFGAVFFNQGQCCVAGARVYVQDAVYDDFVARLTGRAAQVKLGSGLDPQTTMGPLVSAEQRDRVLSLIDSGVAEGARPASGTGRADEPGLRDGFFVSPVILTGVAREMRVMREEIFGPVALVSRFSTEAGAVQAANGFGKELGREALDAYLQTKTVWVDLSL